MLSLKEVQKIYQTRMIETVALENVNLEIEQGDFVSVMGPSGCGKSTLLNIMGLLDQPTQGEVYFQGKNMAGLTDRQAARLRNHSIGFIFQSFHLISALSVLDNVMMPLLYRSMPSSQRRQRAIQALEQVGLSHRMSHFPSELSGGQSQRVAIARAIVGEPCLLLADEPTGNLDSRNGEEIMNILASLNTAGTTIVMVTHDETLARRSKQIIRFFDGRQVFSKTECYAL